MSEKKPSELILDAVKDIASRLDKLEKLEKPLTTTLTPESHKDLDELLNCPTCKGRLVEKLKPDIERNLKVNELKNLNEKLKKKELLTCDGCGEIVEKESPECPSCHGKRAH